MDDFCYVVYKYHDILLKHLSRISEVPNITKPKHAKTFRSWGYTNEISHKSDVGGNNLCTCVTQTQSQESPDLDNGVLDEGSLHYFLVFSGLVLDNLLVF